MKKFLIFLMAIWICAPIFAYGNEEETLFGTLPLFQGDIEWGGFGGPTVSVSEINGEAAVQVGGRGGVIINHHLWLGGGGCGVASNRIEVESDSPEQLYLHMGYGGGMFGYVFSPHKLAHFSVASLIGAGGYSIDNNEWDSDEDNDDAYETGPFFVFEPEANIIINVAKNFRIGVGGSYRFISGMDSKLISASDLDGPSGHILLKFGHF